MKFFFFFSDVLVPFICHSDFFKLDGSKCRIGLIKTRWNKEIIDSLGKGIRTSLTESNVDEANIFETEVYL